MARTLKTTGLKELKRLKERAKRQETLGRIGEADKDFIVIRLDEIEARIISMQEFNENGEEE